MRDQIRERLNEAVDENLNKDGIQMKAENEVLNDEWRMEWFSPGWKSIRKGKPLFFILYR